MAACALSGHRPFKCDKYSVWGRYLAGPIGRRGTSSSLGWIWSTSS